MADQTTTITYPENHTIVWWALPDEMIPKVVEASIQMFPEKFNELIPNPDFDEDLPEGEDNLRLIRKWDPTSPESLNKYAKSIVTDYVTELVSAWENAKAKQQIKEVKTDLKAITN